MNIFQKGMNKILVARAAKHIGKEKFLSQLYTAWYPLIGKSKYTTLEELEGAWQRITQSGIKSAFDTSGITKADIKALLDKIVKDKAKQ